MNDVFGPKCGIGTTPLFAPMSCAESVALFSRKAGGTYVLFDRIQRKWPHHSH